MALGDRMMQFEEFETLDDLTAEQVAELLSIYDELQNLFQVQFKYSLVSNDQSTSLSTEELFFPVQRQCWLCSKEQETAARVLQLNAGPCWSFYYFSSGSFF